MEHIERKIKSAVEGVLDEAVLKQLLRDFGIEPYPVYGKRGKNDLKKRIGSYCKAAKHDTWVVLVDLDNDFECAPQLYSNWIRSPSQNLCFRVAVHEIESWLLADMERISAFLSVSKKNIPSSPDAVEDPKGLMVDLARRSRSSRIRADMVPSPKSGRKIGPGYTSSLIEYVIDPIAGWRAAAAAERSESLRRCFDALRRIR